MTNIFFYVMKDDIIIQLLSQWGSSTLMVFKLLLCLS